MFSDEQLNRMLDALDKQSKCNQTVHSNCICDYCQVKECNDWCEGHRFEGKEVAGVNE